MKLARMGAALLICGITSTALAQQHFNDGRNRGDERGNHGGNRWGDHRGGDWRPGHGGNPHDHDDDRFDRPDHDVFNAQRIGAVDIARGRAYQIINANIDVYQIKLCVRRDDLDLIRLDVLLNDGRSLTLATNDYIEKGTCSRWRDLPGNAQIVRQIMIAGSSDRDGRNPRVVVFGRVRNNHPNPNPNPGGRSWVSWNNTSCGDSQGPFLTDSRNNQLYIMPCPDQKPNGGPIGMNCGHLARGTLCYGWRQQQNPGFYCAAPKGKYPPNPAYVYSMYQCQ